jgi:hypothetical protein
MSEDKRSQTHTDGQVYTHPRGKKYRDEFERIFGKTTDAHCDCEKECEKCKCLTGENLSDA